MSTEEKKYFAAPSADWTDGWWGPAKTREDAIKQLLADRIDDMSSCVTAIGHLVTTETHPDLYEDDERITEWDYQVEEPYRHHDLTPYLNHPTHQPATDTVREAEEPTCRCDVPVTDARRRTHCHLCGQRKRKGKRLPRREVEGLKERCERWENRAASVKQERDTALAQLDAATKERDEARKDTVLIDRIEAIFGKWHQGLVLSRMNDEWRCNSGHHKGESIREVFTAAIDAAGGTGKP